MFTSLDDAAANDLLRFSRAVSGQLAASLNGMDNVHAFTDRTKDGVVSVEPRRSDGGQEKLGPAGVSASVGHGKNAWLVVLEGKSRSFTGDLPARAAGASTSGHWVFGMRTAALNHEVFNHTMEVEPVVVPHFHEFDEIGDRIGCTAVKEVDGDVACAGFHENLHGRTTERHLKRICLPCGKAHVHNGL